MGKIELIFGSMFSGKTEEMMRRVRRGEIAGQTAALFKPSTDTRYGSKIRTHDSRISAAAQTIENPADILRVIHPGVLIAAIDETQFFDLSLLPVLEQLSARGLRVICAGLDLWATGEPIEIMGRIACIADEVTKLKAVCTGCGKDAYISSRDGGATSQVDIGGNEKYTALCRNCNLKQSHSLSQ